MYETDPETAGTGDLRPYNSLIKAAEDSTAREVADTDNRPGITPARRQPAAAFQEGNVYQGAVADSPQLCDTAR